MGLLRKKSNQNHHKFFQNPLYRFSALDILGDYFARNLKKIIVNLSKIFFSDFQ